MAWYKVDGESGAAWRLDTPRGFVLMGEGGAWYALYDADGAEVCACYGVECETLEDAQACAEYDAARIL